MKKNIAVFGGAFSPPTVAHISNATKILDIDGIDEIWVMPAFNHRLKAESASYADRLTMCHLAFSDINEKIKVTEDDYNAYTNGYDGSTKSIMEYLMKAYPDHTFNMVVGQDNADTINTWKDPEWLLEHIHFIVIPRGGCYSEQLTWYDNKPHMFLKESSCITMSSSDVRNAIKENNFDLVRLLVNKDVFEYIKRKNLYINL